MNYTFNRWSSLDNLTLEDMINMILTNGTIDTMNSDYRLCDIIGDTNSHLSVLDFGCGLGRNIFGFANINKKWSCYGYDNVNMLSRTSEFLLKKYNKNIDEYPNVKLISDWKMLSDMKFDCIYATLVLQHIFEIDLNKYLQDIKKMTKKLIVFGRRFNDDMIDGKYKNTWQILENNGYYPSNANDIGYSVDGDPNQHITCVYDF